MGLAIRLFPLARWGAPAVIAVPMALACTRGPTAPVMGTLRVSTITTGSDIDPDGYLLQVGRLPPRPIAANGPIEEFDLIPGSYAVALTALEVNCTLPSATMVAVVGSDSITDLTLDVTCTARSGTLHVSVITDGEDLDLDGYEVYADTFDLGTVPANDSTIFTTVPPGERSITLRAVASNCAVTSEPSVAVSISYTKAAAVDFALACEHTSKLGFMDNFLIKSVNLDGTGEFTLSPGWLLALNLDWSPDGRRIVFSGPWGDVWIMESDGSQLTEVEFNDAKVGSPSWAPAGDRLAVSLWTLSYASVAVYTCDLNGGDLRQVTSGQFRDLAPDWSPDGTRLVFVREYPNSERRLFTVNADGTGLAQLTDGTDDREPAWSPDGTTIAFTGQGPTGERRVYLVRPNGEERESLLPIEQRVWGYSPSWSAEGADLLVSEGNRLYFVHVSTREVTWSFNLGAPLSEVQILKWRP
jgi:WD40 repeat protein